MNGAHARFRLAKSLASIVATRSGGTCPCVLTVADGTSIFRSSTYDWRGPSGLNARARARARAAHSLRRADRIVRTASVG